MRSLLPLVVCPFAFAVNPEIGGLGLGVLSLHEDGKGNLWLGLFTGLWRWKPGPPEFYAIPGQPNGIRGLADAEDGALLISTPSGVSRLVNGNLRVVYPFPVTALRFDRTRMLRDRDGSLWVGTEGRGIVHVHRGKTDVFSQSDGLSGDNISHFFENREGNIWVATPDGLDRFRELPVVTYSTKQGSSNGRNGTVLAAEDGSVWFGTHDGVNRLNKDLVTAYRRRRGQTMPGVREIAVSALPIQGIESLFRTLAVA